MATLLAVAEINRNVLTDSTGELVAAAKAVASDGDEIVVAVLSDDPSTAAASAAGLGADRVLTVQHEALAEMGAGGFEAPVAAVTAISNSISPSTILLSKSDFGANVGPRVAARVGGGFAQDCIGLSSAGNGRISVTRPVYGGNALAEYAFVGDGVQVLTVRPTIFDPVSGDGASPVESFDAPADIGNNSARLVETVAEESQGVRLEDADVVISGGRGLGGPEPFEQLQGLANVLGGALGASRAACDAGWIDHSHQIGLTGKSVSPNVYITFGISGASQHMAGCSGSKVIVAVNKDADANIFKDARFGVVGDWEKVLAGFRAAVDDLAVS
jgi:electron transfer flavoprotein alpha subunit